MRRLKAGGFTREQAGEAIVDSHVGALATKADPAEFGADIPKVAIGIVIATVPLTSTLTYTIVRIAAPWPAPPGPPEERSGEGTSQDSQSGSQRSRPTSATAP